MPFDVKLVLFIDEQGESHFFEKEMTLPFAPFPGLRISTEEDSEFGVRVREVVWLQNKEIFSALCELVHCDNFYVEHWGETVAHIENEGWFHRHGMSEEWDIDTLNKLTAKYSSDDPQ